MNNTYALNDEEYGRVLDNFVIACVDVVVIHNNKILLEKRKFNPIEGEWWIFGGRVTKGEKLADAAARGLQRELQLSVSDVGRFVNIGVFNLVWPIRREPIESNGCHHLLIAHAIEITDEEAEIINRQTFENQIEWFDLFQPQDNVLPEMHDIIAKSVSVLNLHVN